MSDPEECQSQGQRVGCSAQPVERVQTLDGDKTSGTHDPELNVRTGEPNVAVSYSVADILDVTVCDAAMPFRGKQACGSTEIETSVDTATFAHRPKYFHEVSEDVLSPPQILWKKV